MSLSVLTSIGRDSVASWKASLNKDQGIIVPAIALNVAGRQRNDTPVAIHQILPFGVADWATGD